MVKESNLRLNIKISKVLFHYCKRKNKFVVTEKYYQSFDLDKICFGFAI